MYSHNDFKIFDDINENLKINIKMKHMHSDKLYLISLSSVKCSGYLKTLIDGDPSILNNIIEINMGNIESFKIIIKYMDFYKDKEESSALDDLEYSDLRDYKKIFGSEYIVFKDLLDTENISEGLNIITDLWILADYLLMKEFLKKTNNLCVYLLSKAR